MGQRETNSKVIDLNLKIILITTLNVNDWNTPIKRLGCQIE